jgi:hypothetical protein
MACKPASPDLPFGMGRLDLNNCNARHHCCISSHPRISLATPTTALPTQRARRNPLRRRHKNACPNQFPATRHSLKPSPAHLPPNMIKALLFADLDGQKGISGSPAAVCMTPSAIEIRIAAIPANLAKCHSFSSNVYNVL